MTLTASQIGDLVVRIQNEFLASPSLRLMLPDAVQRFGVERHSCSALLNLLVDGSVLTRTEDGGYVRCFPRCDSARAYTA